MRKKCGRNHKDECRYGTNSCFLCGNEGHFTNNCLVNPQNQFSSSQANQNQIRVGHNQFQNQANQFHAMQAQLDGLTITQGRLEATRYPKHNHIIL